MSFAKVWAIALAGLTIVPLTTCCATQRTEWLSGTAIALGVGVVLAILSRRIPALWPDHTATAVTNAAERRSTGTVAVITVLAFALYLVVATQLFAGRPILIDEIASLRQAQIFASGHLWLPAPPHPEFFSTLQMVTARGRVFSQYPPGGPAALTPFVLIGAPWLAGPVYAALAVVAVAAFNRAAEPDTKIALGGTLLFALAPFVVFMSGTHMNCVPTLTCLMIGAAATAYVTRSPTPRTRLAFGAGLAFGVAATIRPVDALAFALPAAVWFLIQAHRRDSLAALVGATLPVGLMLYVNAHTTGAPFLFGYEVFWGKGHDIGFHRTPLGETHTPARGLQFVATYIVQLNTYLFETPIPSLLPAIVALGFTKRLRTPDRYLLASGTLLAVLYSTYWHAGFYLGPRFFYTLTPIFALWTARLPLVISRAGLPVLAKRSVVYALAASALIALALGVPTRTAQYASSFQTEKWAQPDVAQRAGVHNALIFVHDGWDAQLIARLWASGVPATDAERLLRNVDACRLDSAVTAIEHTKATHPVEALTPLVADSSRVQVVKLGPGQNVRIESGYHASPYCLARATDASAGVTPLAPLLVLRDSNLYVRDLADRDTVIIAQYPSRPRWTLRPATNASDALPVFVPMR